MLWVGLDVVRQEFAKARWGSDACGMFRQSRSLTDRTGAVWWGVLWSGSLGHERFRLARLGWAVKAGKVAMRNGEVRSGEAGGLQRLEWDRWGLF